MRAVMIVNGDAVDKVESFKYPASFIQKNSDFFEDLNVGLNADGSSEEKHRAF